MARLKSSICAIAHVDNDIAVGQVGQAPKLCCVMSLTACWLHTVGCTLLVRFVLCSDPPSFDPPPPPRGCSSSSRPVTQHSRILLSSAHLLCHLRS